MICVSVTPTSRQLAKVDLLNACRVADMVEFCLDHLAKEPDMADLLSAANKPVLVSCRRKEDGGQWSGSEEDRQQLLRQVILAGPDYVELELDIANSIPRFGNTKRVISYASPDSPLSKVDDIIAHALLAHADVLKFTWPTADLDAAWPLLAACTGKRELPIVGEALGEGSRTFSILAHKFGSPWTYAALEQGMEVYEGQPSIWELREKYDLNGINAKTKLVGLLGSESQSRDLAVGLNEAFSKLALPHRCLPLDFRNVEKLAKRLEVLKIRSLIALPGTVERIRPLATACESAVEKSGCLDLLLRQPEGWRGYNLLWRNVLTALERALGSEGEDDRPLDRRSVLLLGTNDTAKSVAYGIARRKGAVTVTGPRDDEAREFAEQSGFRFVSLNSVYDTLCDVVVRTDPSLKFGHRKTELNSGFLKESMTVVDVASGGQETEFLREARERGCRVVEPGEIFEAQRQGLFKAITGKNFPIED